VTFAPRVNCNGNITIKDLAYIGAAAAIRQGDYGRPTVIGRAAVVGMGAVVLGSVADGETVAGNPARPIRRRGAGSSRGGSFDPRFTCRPSGHGKQDHAWLTAVFVL